MKEQNWKEKYGDFAKDMTLRDYYAGLAMRLLTTSLAGKENMHIFDDAVAESAYSMADAMLKAREAK